MVCSSVPTSGAGMSRSGPMIGMISDGVATGDPLELVAGQRRGSTATPPLAPPYGMPMSAHFQVIHIASARTSSRSVAGWKRMPPLAGPAGEVVLHPVAAEHLDVPVVAPQRHRHRHLPARRRAAARAARRRGRAGGPPRRVGAEPTPRPTSVPRRTLPLCRSPPVAVDRRAGCDCTQDRPEHAGGPPSTSDTGGPDPAGTYGHSPEPLGCAARIPPADRRRCTDGAGRARTADRPWAGAG